MAHKMKPNTYDEKFEFVFYDRFTLYAICGNVYSLQPYCIINLNCSLMRNLLTLCVLLIGLSAAAQTHRCGATTQKGTPCKNIVKTLGSHCWMHGGTTTANAEVYFCGALTAKGTPCKRRVRISGMKCHSHK